MSTITNTGIIEIASSDGALFTGVRYNDFLVCSEKAASVWIGSGSNCANYLQVGSNVTNTSNLNVLGMCTLSNLNVIGNVTGFNGVSSNQSFSNVWSSNIYGSNVEVVGPMKVTGVVTASGGFVGNATSASTALACTGNAATATSALTCTGNAATATTSASCTGNAYAASNFIGTPNIVVGNITSTGAHSNIGTLSNSGAVYASSFVGPVIGNASSATTSSVCSGNAYAASNFIGIPNVIVGNINSTGTHSNVGTMSNSGTVYAGSFVGPISGNATSATIANGLTGTPNIEVGNLNAIGNATIGGNLTVTGNTILSSAPTLSGYLGFNGASFQREVFSFNQVPNATTNFPLPQKGGSTFIVHTYIDSIGAFVGILLFGPFGANYISFTSNGSPYCGTVFWNGQVAYNASWLGGVDSGSWGITVTYVPIC